MKPGQLPQFDSTQATFIQWLQSLPGVGASGEYQWVKNIFFCIFIFEKQKTCFLQGPGRLEPASGQHPLSGEKKLICTIIVESFLQNMPKMCGFFFFTSRTPPCWTPSAPPSRSPRPSATSWRPTSAPSTWSATTSCTGRSEAIQEAKWSNSYSRHLFRRNKEYRHEQSESVLPGDFHHWLCRILKHIS